MVEKAANPVKSLVEILLLFPLLFPIFLGYFFLGSQAKQIRKKASYVEGGRINICLASFLITNPLFLNHPFPCVSFFGPTSFSFSLSNFSLNPRACALEVDAKCMFMSIKLPKLLVVPPFLVLSTAVEVNCY